MIGVERQGWLRVGRRRDKDRHKDRKRRMGQRVENGKITKLDGVKLNSAEKT